MSDTAKGAEGARVDKYSDEQVEHSRQLLGGAEPEGADLAAHHDAPAGGTVHAGPDDGEAAEAADTDGEA